MHGINLQFFKAWEEFWSMFLNLTRVDCVLIPTLISKLACSLQIMVAELSFWWFCRGFLCSRSWLEWFFVDLIWFCMICFLNFRPMCLLHMSTFSCSCRLTLGICRLLSLCLWLSIPLRFIFMIWSTLYFLLLSHCASYLLSFNWACF